MKQMRAMLADGKSVSSEEDDWVSDTVYQVVERSKVPCCHTELALSIYLIMPLIWRQT